MDADFKSALGIITASADQSYEQTRLSLDEFFIKYKICTNLSGVQMETLTSLVDSIGNFLEDKLKFGEDAEQIDEVLEVVIRTLLVLTRDRRSQRSILECCLQSLLLCAKITIIPSTVMYILIKYASKCRRLPVFLFYNFLRIRKLKLH